MKKLIPAIALVLAGCATTGEPRVETVTVKVPVAAPCPDKRNPPPTFVDSLEAIQGAVGRGEIDKAFGLLLGGRDQRIQWQAESDAQIAACARPPNPG
jgi:hypothetical protein